MTTIYTIGHSNHEVGKFLDLLKKYEIQQLVDVRSSPRSRFNPHFNRQSLESRLKSEGIEYVYAGNQLGGRPTDPGCYIQRAVPVKGTDSLHEVDYAEVMKKNFFQQGIKRLIELTAQKTTAIMCSEEDPAKCHRHHLIAKFILASYPDHSVLHIRGDGTTNNANLIPEQVKKEAEKQPPLFSLIAQELI